jgi:hypothetical protein
VASYLQLALPLCPLNVPRPSIAVARGPISDVDETRLVMARVSGRYQKNVDHGSERGLSYALLTPVTVVAGVLVLRITVALASFVTYELLANRLT